MQVVRSCEFWTCVPTGQGAGILTAFGDYGAPVPPALIVERAERSGRLSVAFRLLLILPQIVVLLGLGLVGAVAVVAGWFAALVGGRLPEPIARYLCHYTRYSTRVSAYYWLLTDRYPPFRLSAEDYPVRVELAPGRLNRWAVLFRYVLVYPALLLLLLVLTGWAVAAFFIWLVVLVAGRVPRPLFDATTALLRYNVRSNAYLWLLTSAYPWGLFGDRAATAGLPETAWAAEAAETTETTEAAEAAEAAGTAGGPGPAGVPDVPDVSEEAPPWAPLAPAPSPPPAPAWAGPTAPFGAAAGAEPPSAPWGLLVLSTGAKRLLVLFMVLGVLPLVAGGVIGGIASSSTLTRTEALSDLRAAH